MVKLSTKALTGTALQQPQELVPAKVKPRVIFPRHSPLTPEQKAVYEANRAEIEKALEEKRIARQTANFNRLNAAEIKRERKRAKARKEAGYV